MEINVNDAIDEKRKKPARKMPQLRPTRSAETMGSAEIRLVAACEELGANRIDVAPATWYLKQGVHDCLIGIQVDDLLLCASTGGFAILAYLRAGLERILNIKLKWEPNPQDVVGLRMDRDRATKH